MCSEETTTGHTVRIARMYRNRQKESSKALNKSIGDLYHQLLRKYGPLTNHRFLDLFDYFRTISEP